MTPSEFYRQRRPEVFSDSQIVTQIILPREVLAYELSKISTNQKQDEFETLCRRLAEKFISPNLIPQVGPTGGGDGKTDSETYPVSESISDRWFTPENGWNKDENWAFAISAKEEWKGKAKSDVKKIVETNRGYTRVYFISNQLISSKKKKDAQDEFIKEFEIDVVILDGEWILEKIYNNNLIDLIVDSLNLSSIYKNKETKLGSNDTRRLEELKELEENINNPNRYSEYDFQLTEDALRSAILSRMLEKPRDEVEGKFDRALRFGSKLKNRRQLMRIYYQKAWTYMYWYDDYILFVENFNNYKSFISKESNLSEIEDYCNLFSSLYSLKRLEKQELENLNINLEIEEKEITTILENIASDSSRPTSSLFAKTELVFFKLIQQKTEISQIFNELSIIIEQSENYLDYPFDSTRKIIEEILSEIFFDNDEFDNLIDVLASISAKRNSELEAGQIFLRRGIKKLQSENYKDSIIYFGKSIKKLAKEEAHNTMFFALFGLGKAYENLGLIWASNNCFITACHFSFKLTDQKGTLSDKTYEIVKEILTNELFIGRVPYLLTWHEMFLIFQRTLTIDESKDEIAFNALCDGTFAVRLLHTKNTFIDELKYLPDILAKQELWLSQDTALYKQGYVEICIKDREDITNEEELDEYYKMVANQPFVEQILYDTNYMSEDKLSLYSHILGCQFQINFAKDIEMLLVSETLLAYFESFAGTSLSNIHAHREKIIINVFNNTENTDIYFTYDEDTYEYNFYIKNFNKQENEHSLVWNKMIEFTVNILFKNFIINDAENHFKKLFEKDEVHERLALIFGHRNSVLNILGDKPKLFFDDWVSYYKPNEYKMKRETPLSFNYEKTIKDSSKKYTKDSMAETSHNKVMTHTIIDMSLWDKAKWRGFGFVFHPQDGLYIFLAFDNIEYGKKILDKWLQNFGSLDKEDIINITIIKGIDKKEPFAYKIMISKNEKFIKSTISDGIVNIVSRFHKMDAKTPENLNNLISCFNYFKKYKLIPASINDKGEVEPIFDKAIVKTTLIIKNAWEIGVHDLARSVIQRDDNPIIPDEHKNNAPIIKVMMDLNSAKKS
jgi:hypothetical protein